MQEDSLNVPTSGYSKNNRVFTQESPKKSFQCSHCILLFKSKVYLFEHLNKVHGFDVDASLREAGLKYPETNKANNDGNSNSTEDDFECQHCGFKACSQDILNEHERQCQKKAEDVMGNLIISENPETSLIVMSANQHGEAAGAKEISSVFSVMSTSKSLCTLNSSKDLKTYKRPLKTINQYFTASSGSNRKPPGNSAESPNLLDGTKGTIILKESPSSSSPNSSGVFKVTAKSTIDIAGVSCRFLRDDQLRNTDPSAQIPKEQSRETVPDNVGKRTNSEIPKSPPAKKAKSYKEETKLPQEEHATGQQSSSYPEFPFDISEDDEEKKLCLVNGDSESSTVYTCKHCVYSDVSVACASTHYQNDHPYVRYSAAYIQDPSDRSATFRCLHCPVEFVSVAALKKHYSENHPEAPNVFKMQSCELGLVFRCFLCVFTTNALKALKKHYMESHPTHGVDNPLLYCRYLATRCQEGSTQSNVCEKAQSPERPAGIAPESAGTPCQEVKNAPSAQHPTSTGADVVLYHCNTCKFSNKSVVVMHVHYQKCHPGQEITIDKIKQSACVTPHTTPPMTPDESPDSVTIPEESAPQTNVSDPSKKTKSKADQSQQRKRESDAPKTQSESSQTKIAESTEDEGKRTELPNKRNRGVPKEKVSLSSMPPSGLFFCQFCSYSSTNIKSVLGHHNAKHSLHALTCMEEILCYSAQVQKKKLQSEAKTLAKSASSDSKPSKQVEVQSEEVLHEEDDVAGASVTEDNPYACAENLFYCQKCNYGNPSVKGIANHQTRIHKSLPYRRECIIEHTALIRDQIETSKSQAKEFSFSTRLPLPLLNEGDEDAFFCHFCNYRQITVDYVVRHYIKKHRGFVVKGEQVRLHTSMVHEKTKKPHSETADQDATHASLGGKGNKKKKMKMLGKFLPGSAPPSMTASQTQRILRCYRCPYNTQFVYVLRRHIWKIHRANRSITDVLRVCFKQGTLQTGYHCDVCVFSHERAAAVYEHYQEEHPRRSPSLEYVSTRLYVGPDSQPPTRRKPQIKYTDGIGDCDGTDGSSPAQRSVQSETKIYSCKACSFKGSSVSGLTRHYRAIHPWSVKEDGSVLGVVNSKRPSANRQVEDGNVMPESFESYQAPLEFEAAESSTRLGCPYCPAMFNTQHGLNTHCGMKHHEAEYENSDQHQERIQTHMPVFKCPHCTYVNTSHQGVLSHCHMKHPALASRAESFHVDEAQVSNWSDCLKRRGPGNLRLSGYMCETCPQIYATLEKLNKHCEKDHTRSVAIAVPSTPNPDPEPDPEPEPKPSSVGQRKQYRTLSNRGSVSQASFLSKKIYAVIKCQYCNYSCSTKIALDRHVRVHHKAASVSKAQDCVYKCVLCSNSYHTKIQLGSHYVKKHGRDSFLKYHAPVYKQVQEKQPSTSHDEPLTQKPENTQEACKTSTLATEEEGSKRLLVYRCPSCPYVNTSYHGTLTHCQMKHPDIVARADGLQTEETLGTNLIGCKIGKGANERGYVCKICPLIYPSLKKLKSHCARDHDNQALPAAPEHSTDIETEKQPDLCSQVCSASEQVLESTATEVSTTENDLGHQSAAKTCQPNAMSVPNMVTLYKCHICSYKGFYRRYLLCHYKKTHKLDPLTTHKLLQKYNKRKRALKLPEAPAQTEVEAEAEDEAESEEEAPFQCKKCPELIFDSSQLLVAHYSTFHSSECILDFTVLSRGSKKGSTGLYRCVHCNKQMNGIRKLSYHLDCHREVARKRAEAAKTETLPEAKSLKLLMQDELLTLETVDELAQWNVTSVQTFTLPPSPLSPLSKPADEEQPQLEPREDKQLEPREDKQLEPREEKHACRLCRRTFMSLKGLRSHERSHAAMAAIKKLNNAPTSVLKHNINKFVLYKAGTIKPFLCSFCSYRTTVMGLWRCHFRKVHQGVMIDPTESDDEDEESFQRADKEPFNSSEEYWPELDEEPEIAEKSLYLEPPDVQRQLNHYTSIAQADSPSETNVQETKLPENRLLHCEFCNFNTGHLSSQRRHYLNRHGKKILRCKDCDFFTGFRKTLEMHMKAGHSTRQSEPTREKDLRCPFCLYQTRNKNNMIDHIVLHREERVVPIEVRRPKLSRYLKGIVFRCHKCTFSSGSADNLRLHMTRHDDVKPYKCRLCYFDCTWLSDLEAHLSDKHQVLRNHELVGQVSLDQLQARVGRMPEEEPSSNLEHHSNGSEDVETEEFVTDSNEVPLETQAEDPAENSTGGEIALQSEEAYLKQGQDGEREESPDKSSALDLQCENAKPSAAVQEKREQEPAGTVALPARPILGDSEGGGMALTQQKEEAAEGSSLTRGEKAEDIGICRTHEEADQDGTVKTEDIETEVVDNVRSELVLLDERGSVPQSHEPTNQVYTKIMSVSARKTMMQANNSRPQGSFIVARHLLTLSSKCAQLKVSHEESSGVSVTNCKKEQAHSPKNSAQVREPYGEMPVLENEYLKEEMQPPGCGKEGGGSDRLEQKRDKEDEAVTKDDENKCTKRKPEEGDGMKNAGTPQGELAAADGAAEASRPAATEEKRFTCEFCGRNLVNSSDLERHIMRHRL